MAEIVRGAPWPEGPVVLDLDRLDVVASGDLASLEGRRVISVGAVSGPCTGDALAAAMAVDLLVAGPGAAFGRPGRRTDIVIRRGTGIAGRKVMAYLSMTDRMIDALLARRWGIVTRIADDPLGAAVELADEVSRRSEVAVATILSQAHRGAAADYTGSGATDPFRFEQLEPGPSG